ncbi:unnamed protein product [Boreogadus saida]
MEQEIQSESDDYTERQTEEIITRSQLDNAEDSERSSETGTEAGPQEAGCRRRRVAAVRPPSQDGGHLETAGDT